MSEPQFQKLVLVGVGLMGASAGLAAKARGVAREVVGFSRKRETLEEARRVGAIDAFETDLAAAVKGADLVLVSVPVDAIVARVKEIAELAPDAAITDVGSVKGNIVSVLSGVANFVGGHPIAGTEKSGPTAGIATLYEGRYCILTPAAGAAAGNVGRVRAFWEALGMRVEEMDATRHDEVLAMISHLPHLVAYALVGAVAGYDSTEHPALKFTAGGFKDFTRIAASSPQMWREIIAANKDASLESLGRFRKSLDALEAAVRAGDFEKVEKIFADAAKVRRELDQSR